MTETRNEADETLQALFERQAALSPDATALRCDGHTMTYAELDAEANRRAHLLQGRGMGPGRFVGIVMDHTFDLVIDILAALKTGAAYVPMEPTFPRGRIAYIIEKAAISCVLTRRAFADIFDEADGSCLIFDDTDFSAFGTDGLPAVGRGEDAAYVLFTSGTTGNPKGVVVEQRNACHYVRAFRHEFSPTPDDRMLQYSVCTFDIFVEELFPILLSGGTLVIATEADKADTARLMRLMRDERITMLSGFPYLLDELDANRLPPSLRLVISGGDVMRPRHVRHLLGRAEVYNTYGPTETTVCATYYHCPGELPEHEPVPVGMPVQGARIYLLDENMQQVGTGQVGEICIAGAGVSRGYLDDPEETDAVFMDDPFGAGRLYRSGDLGYQRPDGQLVFLRRKDTQVMIEGKRVEPRGVENVMFRFPGITGAVVRTVLDGNDYPYLVGYYSATADIDEAELRAFLADYLPDFMIPESLVQIEGIPLTDNGKVDLSALPRIAKREAAHETHDDIAEPYHDFIAERDAMGLEYRKATLADLDELVATREEVMHEVWDLSADADLGECMTQTREYYREALPSAAHSAFLVHDGDDFMACAGISYYRVMPTYDNPTGRKAYVMNMYVRPAYRHRGIASHLLQLLCDDARAQGIDFISLEASESGRLLYANAGFAPMPDEMLLRLKGGNGDTR